MNATRRQIKTKYRAVQLLAATLAIVLVGCSQSGTGQDGEEAAFNDGDVVTLIVPTDPGGGVDSEARILQPYFETALQESTGTDVRVQVQNQPGAEGRVGAQNVAEAGQNQLELISYYPGVLLDLQLKGGENARYDVNELTPLALLGQDTLALMLRSEYADGVPQGDIKALAERSREDALVLADTGIATDIALMNNILADNGVELDLETIKVDGTAAAIPMLLRGDAHATLTTTGSLVPVAEENSDLELFVTTGCEASEVAPDVPTVVEAAWPGAEELCQILSLPRAILGPPSMANEHARILEAALLSALENEEFLQKMVPIGREMNPGGAEEVTAAIKARGQALEDYPEVLETP